MSKSLGNGVDPMEVIEKYGADFFATSYLQEAHRDKIYASVLKKSKRRGTLPIKFGMLLVLH